MRSMTGYGRGEHMRSDRRFIVELRAVNHRYNDLNIKLPRIMLSYEDIIRKIVSKEIFRGKTDVFVSFETFSKNDYKVSLNKALSDCYVDVLTEIKNSYNIDENISLGLVARFPDVVSVEKTLSENEAESCEIIAGLTEAVKTGLNAFIKMREREGAALKADLRLKLDGIKTIVDNISERAPFVAEEYKQRLKDKLSEFKELNLDEGRILTEVAIFADRTCVDEELTRLYSHIDQFKTIIEEDGPIGRKLDFLVQEMNREVNTTGSKSNDLIVTENIVKLKTEIEKIREQVQNIE